ncbi:hypothetical protein FG93_01942 [Bosea sp. LC85]|uniref:phage tail terminator-like protein n=1 Tax=Bosea sp. LC85 TaxID=1502851 RepID=UPI0004E3AE8C|nr:phage tail terminator-like protein [Bosea sp. LC85]KFC73198.1 hypothetical protein FG93_01942 [Bosea sp. LC85]
MADFAGAVAAIRLRLEGVWNNATPIAWPNEKRPIVTDADGKPAAWVYAEVTGTDSGIRGVGKPGAHVIIDDGLIELTAFVPADTGTAEAFTNATALGEIFRTKQFYDADPGACIRTWSPRVGGADASADSGMWVGVTVTIPFEFWRIA